MKYTFCDDMVVVKDLRLPEGTPLKKNMHGCSLAKVAQTSNNEDVYTVGDIVAVDLGESKGLPDGSWLVSRWAILASLVEGETPEEQKALQALKDFE